MRADRDRLINTGVGNIYFLFITLLVTLTGLLYVLSILPAYDPAVLAQPRALTFLEYLGLSVGGLMIFGSFLFRDKIRGLKTQFAGLAIQTGSALVLAITVIMYGGLSSLFIVIFAFLVSFMHIANMKSLKREISNAPLKRALAEKIDEPLAKGDQNMQLLVFLEKRCGTLEIQLKDVITEFEMYRRGITP